MRVIRNHQRISRLAVAAGGAFWAWLLEKGCWVILWQVTALDTEAGEEAGALDFCGAGPGVQGVEIFGLRPSQSRATRRPLKRPRLWSMR